MLLSDEQLQFTSIGCRFWAGNGGVAGHWRFKTWCSICSCASKPPPVLAEMVS